MKNITIQIELRSVVRAPARVLNFALSSERGQEIEKENLHTSAPNWNNQVNAITNNALRPASWPQQQQQQTQQTSKSKEQRWRCAGIFYRAQLNQCAAKQAICSICRKTGHFAKMCRSKIPPIAMRKHHLEEHTNEQRTRKSTKALTNTGKPHRGRTWKTKGQRVNRFRGSSLHERIIWALGWWKSHNPNNIHRCSKHQTKPNPTQRDMDRNIKL